MRTELIGSIGDLVRRQAGAHGPRPLFVDDGRAVALVAHCREQLAAYKLPRAIAFVPELPKTASGKVQRFLLRGGA
jgi:acyl-coenzyme A synthetase/AMP-(fatty) acid ligase